jgi:hypothetical protein
MTAAAPEVVGQAEPEAPSISDEVAPSPPPSEAAPPNEVKSPHDAALTKPGYFVQVADGRLWVFREGSEAMKEYQQSGEPAKCVTLVGVGPDGMTVRSDDRQVIVDYLTAKPGFVTKIVDDRLWVFEEGSEGLKEFEASGEPAKSVTLIGEGPLGMTIRSDDRATIDKYLAP